MPRCFVDNLTVAAALKKSWLLKRHSMMLEKNSRYEEHDGKSYIKFKMIIEKHLSPLCGRKFPKNGKPFAAKHAALSTLLRNLSRLEMIWEIRTKI
jgi:hypothetical protein